jgi:hypothetical protein
LIALAIVAAVMGFAVVAGIMWRWIQMAERVGVEREKAGGDDRAKAMQVLDERVTKIEGYMEGKR